MTVPNGSAPGEGPSSSRHGNGTLSVGLSYLGRIVATDAMIGPDGAIRVKFPWWRAVSGGLSIEGRSLDGAGPLVRAEVPPGYGSAGFQASSIFFPSEGCWEVTGRVGESQLTFVVSVTRATAVADGTTAEPPACRVTRANGRVPVVQGAPARDAGVNHGNGRLFVSLGRNGRIVAKASEVAANGEIDVKVPWWRTVPGALRVSATRLDAKAPPARAHIPSGYGRRWLQPTGITFPTTGCWRVTGAVGRSARLSFVTLVVVRTA